MDIKQQTKNVAAQGRFGDSMLLHVNPEEVKGLASSMPITMNPETGQPEAFLPFLAPMLGSLLGGTFLTGAGAGALGGLIGAKGLSAAAAAGIGAGLATYAQTGGSGSKALLSGLTAGLGTKALGTQAQAVDPSIVARDTGAAESLKTIFTQPEVLASEGVKAANPFDLGVKSLGSAAMSPSGMAAATAAGTGAVMQSQEEFERMLAQMDIDEEERKKRMYEMYPEQIPVASGGKIGFLRGRNTYDPRYDPRESIDFNPNLGNNLTGQYQLPARRTARPIPRGFMPGFQPEFSYFESINPTATNLGFGQTQGFNSFAPPRRGGFAGLFGQRRRPIGGGNIAFPGGSPNFNFRGPRFNRPPMFAGYGNPFMQSPSYQGFYGAPQMQQMLNPYARFVQQPMPFPGFYGRPTPPPFIGGPGYGPQPDPVPDPTPPVADPVPTPPITGPTPPQKGGPTPVEPIQPPDDFVRPEPIEFPPQIGRPPIDRPEPIDRPRPVRPSPMPIDIPMPIGPRPEPIYTINPPSLPPGFNPIKLPIDRPIKPPSIGGPGGGNFIPEPEPVAPPPNITIPIEGGADVTIPDFSRIKTPITPPMIRGLEDRDAMRDEMSIDRVTDMRARYDEPPLQAAISGVQDPFDDGRPKFKPIAPPPPPKPIGERLPFIQQLIPERPGVEKPQPPISIGGPGGGMVSALPVGPSIPFRPPTDTNELPTASPLPIAQPPIVFPIQSVTTPQPIGQQPQPPRTGGIPITGGGPLGSGILPEANLPSGTPTPSRPVDPRIGSGVKIPTGPTMGSITAAPTPRPPINLDVPGPFGGPLFAEGESTNKELPNEGLKALAKTEKGREAIKAMGYQEGQDVNMPTNQSTDMMQDPIVQETIQFILGETDNSDVVNEFIVKYGQEQFMMLRNMILAQAAGNPDVQTEGLIQGTGRSGMADDLPMNIGDKPIAAVSQDEYIIPADVVSMLGDGSSDAGSKQLDGMLDRVRMAKTNRTTQAKPINPNKVLPA